MNILALCAGIGGLELGIEAAGVEVTSCTYVERDPYAAAVLASRVASGALAPGRVFCGDLERLAAADLGPVRGLDLITAGFPCQPASSAGKRQGRADERWIWPLVADIIAKAEPRYVFLENVRGLLTVDAGAGFREVLERLAACGLDARWGLFRAADVGAPHRRERVFILAARPGAVGWAPPKGEPAGRSGHPADGCGLGDAERERWRERADAQLPERGRWRGEAVAGGRGAVEGRDLGPQRVPDPLGDALRNESERGRGAARAADGGDAEPRHLGEAVGDPDGRVRGGRDLGDGRAHEDGWRAGSAERRAEVADADRGRRECERLAEHGDERGARGREPLGHGGDGRLGWPPGPQDAEGWKGWLAAGGPAPAVGGRLSPDFVERLMGFPPGWTDLGYPQARRDRLRCLGNAVVPAQAALAWRILS